MVYNGINAMENRSIFEQDGQKYLRIGNKAIPFESFGPDGKPVIKAIPHVTEHPDGRRDVRVEVPCLIIQPQT